MVNGKRWASTKTCSVFRRKVDATKKKPKIFPQATPTCSRSLRLRGMAWFSSISRLTIQTDYTNRVLTLSRRIGKQNRFLKVVLYELARIFLRANTQKN